MYVVSQENLQHHTAETTSIADTIRRNATIFWASIPLITWQLHSNRASFGEFNPTLTVPPRVTAAVLGGLGGLVTAEAICRMARLTGRTKVFTDALFALIGSIVAVGVYNMDSF